MDLRLAYDVRTGSRSKYRGGDVMAGVVNWCCREGNWAGGM